MKNKYANCIFVEMYHEAFFVSKDGSLVVALEISPKYLLI